MKTQQRAYSFLTVKSVSEDRRIIRGTATTPAMDRVGDVIEPLGVKFKNPMPFLWQHRHDQPIGKVKFDKPTKDGITFEAELPVIDEPGTLKDRVDEAWQSIKLGLVPAVSIGFRPIEYSYIENGGVHFTEIEVYELSAVTIPAHQDALISSVKAMDARALNAIKTIDAEARAASGQAEGEDPPGATGKPPVKLTTNPERKAIPKGGLFDSVPKEGMKMKTISEQITAYKGSRDQKQTRIDEILKAVADRGETPDAAESEELNTLEAEVDAIDTHVKRLEGQEQRNIKAAVPARGNSSEDGQASRAAVSVQVKSVNLPKGTAFTRYAMALGRSKGNLMQAAEIAKGWHDSTPEVETVLKAAVAAGTTTDTAWAAPLVEYQNMASEFAELLRPQTIVGKIAGLRRVPFNIKVPRQTSGSSASWVGETAPKPVSALAFDQITLGHTKLAGIVVLSDELVRFSNPSAEAIVRQDLIDTIVQTMDHDFVDPANAGTTDVKPASVTNGVTPVTASGTDADALRADVKALFAKFIAANMSLASAVWIMTEIQALGIAMMTNALGQPEFPSMIVNGVAGGTLFGLPVILSENIPANAGSGSPVTGDGARIILAKASEIMLADDGQVMLDVSREASLQMDSVPTNPPTASTVMVSLWQENLVGIRAERFVNWKKRRAGAVQYIDAANYGDAA